MDSTNHERIYRLVPLFRGLSPEELDELIGASRLFRVKQGCAVITEGEESDGMFIIVQGRAQVQLRFDQGDRTQLAELGPGDVFGELALLDRLPRSATVVMKEDGVLYKLEAAGFELLRKQLRPSAFKVIRELAPVMAGRLRDINRRVGEFFSDPEASMAMLEERYMGGSTDTDTDDLESY